MILLYSERMSNEISNWRLFDRNHIGRFQCKQIVNKSLIVSFFHQQ